MARIFAVSTVLLLSLKTGYAQKVLNDYIITKTCDTIAVKLKYNWLGNIVYELPGSTKFTAVAEGKIKEFHWSKMEPQTFIAAVLPGDDKPTFVGLLERGQINLYELISHRYRATIRYWYANKENRPLVEINNQLRLFGTDKQLVRHFTDLISDKQQVYLAFKQQKKYNFKTIRKSIQQYNSLRWSSRP
ncbi:hypothetical protein DIU31_027385 [Mucilaginibacter rubeus]|uniref:Uncharacterized protein n=1 Tax=Mucilaginibacter rubeus TaxID=2027860 RepID=A0AAE6JJU8_9SPHI|nr:hypothetical protein [Mucilaginibacter rubeus]QEM07049.1 hypothetical protein DIU31_027385 [Mucilaginibacter rubeus]QTE43809.1 hypothetical protein J3L19_00040 [Mucilaginibacter rubeus]QTE50409.1 hypothetical protein J3L21_00020 [Mucilaginibacter rubeus]QTE55495.1 hypothetical protein J3L23_25260 [Mucilaginibacter rubeus]QTE65043.1 hypothetical protein J3L22_08560 [Mucilaginibacter rubeus]